MVEVSLAQMQQYMSEALQTAKDLGVETKPLEAHELVTIGKVLERNFVVHYIERDIVDIYYRHMAEIVLGALVAKSQMKQEIDGESPGPTKVGGPLMIRAGYLGVGDDWEDILGIHGGTQSSWTTGSIQNWIHCGTTLMAGTGGNAIKIGKNAVHVIFGFGSRHPSPKIEAIQVTKDQKPLTPVILGHVLKEGSIRQIRIRELEKSILLNEGSTFLAKIFISNAYGSASTLQQDYPFPIGVSYIREPQLRTMDLSGFPGTTNDAVLTTT